MHKDVSAALEKATEPTRELDAAIWLACFEPTCDRFEVEFHTEQYDNHISRTGIECALGSMWVDDMQPPLRHYTASMDAALDLVERLRPAFFWRVQKQFGDYDGLFWAVCGPHGKPKMQCTALGATPAMAVCGALLNALADGRIANANRSVGE